MKRERDTAREFAGAGLRERGGCWFLQARSRWQDENFPLRLFLCNPCSLIATGRLEDVALALRADANVCPGTRIRAGSGEQYRVQSLGSLGLAMHFGWSRGAYTNRGVACSIILPWAEPSYWRRDRLGTGLLLRTSNEVGTERRCELSLLQARR